MPPESAGPVTRRTRLSSGRYMNMSLRAGFSMSKSAEPRMSGGESKRSSTFESRSSSDCCQKIFTWDSVVEPP